jgi:hypothetical protein
MYPLSNPVYGKQVTIDTDGANPVAAEHDNVDDCYCAAGTYGSGSGGGCTACEQGKFKATTDVKGPGSAGCTDCGAGTYNGGQTRPTPCQVCAASTYTVAPTATVCGNCPANAATFQVCIP